MVFDFNVNQHPKIQIITLTIFLKPIKIVLLLFKRSTKMKKQVFLKLLSVMIITQLSAQTEPWIRISPKPIESSLQEIAHIPGTDRMMAIGTGASLMFTNDMGENWHINYRPGDVPRKTTLNAIHFVDSDIGYAVGSKSTLLKTMDGGISWEGISPAGEENILDVFFISTTVGVFTKETTIWKTINGGQSWDTVSANGTLYYPGHLHFINDSIGFLANKWGSGYFKTTNAGDTWQQVEINPSIEDFTVTAVQYLDQDIGFVSGTVSSISNSEHYILKTVNGGNTWEQVYSHPFNSNRHIYFHNDSIGFAVGPHMYWNMILRTADGGETWHETNMAIAALYLNSFVFSDDGTGLCVGDRGYILKSNDWGQNWENSNEYQCRASIINDAQIIDDSIVYLASKGYGGGIPSGSIYKSTDAGNSWNQVFPLWPMTDIYFLNPLYGFVCGSSYGEVYKTIDGGETWSTHEIDFDDLTTTSLCFINEQVGFVGGNDGQSSKIYKTIDGGNNWYSTLNYPLLWDEIIDMEFIDDSVGFAIGPNWPYYGILLKTYDQGETWEQDSIGSNYNLKKIYFLNSGIGFIICSGNIILKTIDGGNNWYEVPSGITGSISFTDIDFPTDQTGYVTANGNETTVHKTTDGGETWLPIDFPCTATPTTVGFFNEDEGLVMGNGGIIFKTCTGGIVGAPEFPEDIAMESYLYCFPNPVKDILNINLKDRNCPETLIFHDNYGRAIKKIENPKKQEIVKVDVSHWKNGVYFVAAVSNGEIIGGEKFVKVD